MTDTQRVASKTDAFVYDEELILQILSYTADKCLGSRQTRLGHVDPRSWNQYNST